MLKEWNYLYLARVTFEAVSPISIQTGQAELNYDTALSRDANGLPGLPPTATRGVLRHLYQREFGEDACKALFGYGKAEADRQNASDNGQISRLQVSWGALHNGEDKPCEGLQFTADEGDDKVLTWLRESQPLLRERVRLNDRGVAEDQGKYDLTAVPAGARFTLELKYWSASGDDAVWQQLVGLLSHPAFRLGSNTRSGLGALQIRCLHRRCFNMRDADDVQAWTTLGRSLADTRGLDAEYNTDSTRHNALTAMLTLQAEGFMRVGGGDFSLAVPGTDDKTPDMLPQSEAVIIWQKDEQTGQETGEVSERRALLAASGIKGALSHRTLYHSNLVQQRFADQLGDQLAAARVRDHACQSLFGFANDEDEGGLAGRLLIEDIYLDKPDVLTLWHNRIDRFTGGVMDGALYTEQVLREQPFTVRLSIIEPEKVDPVARQAFARALDDLCNGMLPIGAGGSRGLGACMGELSWSDDGAWVEGQETMDNNREAV